MKGTGSETNLVKKILARKNVTEHFFENFYDFTYSFKVVIITFRSKKTIFQNREKVTGGDISRYDQGKYESIVLVTLHAYFCSVSKSKCCCFKIVKRKGWVQNHSH